MNDAYIGSGLLLALTVLLDRDTLPPPRACLLSGVVVGATLGLKLSGAF